MRYDKINSKAKINLSLHVIKKLKNTNILRIGPGEAEKIIIKYFEKKNNKVFLFDYDKAETIKETLNFNSEKNMSVGAILISLCVISGVKTNIIGFDLDTRNVTHYWEKRPKEMSISHDFSYEKSWIRNLVKENIVNSLN